MLPRRPVMIFLALVFVCILFTIYSMKSFQSMSINSEIMFLNNPTGIHYFNNTGNLPEIYLSTPSFNKQFNDTCAKFPELFAIKIRNNNWQLQKTTNGTFHLLNAYVDERIRSVRILGTYDQLQPNSSFVCQFWYQNQIKPEIVLAEPLFWLFRAKWGADKNEFDHPYLITCPLGDNGVPMSVSLVEHVCDNATNNLKVFHRTVEKKKNFVVCVKGLSFPFEDKSAVLAEWIELLNLLGAEKIQFYEFSVHPNTKKLLQYYQMQGKIEVTSLTLVGDFSNAPLIQNLFLKRKLVQRRLQEVLPYNDCLYKHLPEYRYVVLLDTDEVIVPVQNTWIELLENLQRTTTNTTSYLARNIYFMDSHLHQHEWFNDIPKYMYMLQHVYRAKEYTKPGHYVKGFHDTDKVISLHNHYPFSCLDGCKNAEIDLELAHLQHYRDDCVKGISDCEDMKKDNVLDTRVWNFKDQLIKRVQRTFRDLGFLNDTRNY